MNVQIQAVHFDADQKLIEFIKKKTGKQVKGLRTDNGMKFCVGSFNEFCNNEGIVRHCTIKNTPQ